MRIRTTTVAVGALTAVVLAGCGPRNRNETGAAGGAGGESSAVQTPSPGAGETTMAPGRTGQTGGGMGDTTTNRHRMSDTNRMSDTSHMSDTNRTSSSTSRNQTESGVTNTQTGKSTLGHRVTKTRPDAGQPVTSKGDTIRPGGDTAGR